MSRGHHGNNLLLLSYEEAIGVLWSSDVDAVARGAALALANRRLSMRRRMEIRAAYAALAAAAKTAAVDQLASGGISAKLAKVSAGQALTLRTLRRLGRDT
jgi:hypothetical protein